MKKLFICMGQLLFMWGVSRQLLSENRTFFLRLITSIVFCIGGISALVASWFAASQMANAYPTAPISALPIPQLVYNAALPAGAGLALFLLGLLARFASKGSIPWIVVASIVWGFGAYNLYYIGLYRPQAPFNDYLSQTATFFLLGLVIFAVAVLVSWHGEVIALVARHGAKAKKEVEERAEERPLPGRAPAQGKTR